MNSKLLTILTLIIALVAFAVSIMAISRVGGRESIEFFKSEIETIINDLREVKTEVAAQAGNKLKLVEAKTHLLVAKMYITLDNNYDKASEELKKASDSFEKARTGASEATKEEIGRLKSGITEAQKLVGDKSDEVVDKLTELMKETKKKIDSLGSSY